MTPLTSEPQLNRAQSIRLARSPDKKLARVIAISSGKGGVGKSSLSLNLAVELSQRNNHVCVFDADTNLANINIMTGLIPSFTLYDLVRGEKHLKDILLDGPGGIKIIPAASGMMDFVSFDRNQQDSMIDLVKKLEQEFDYILIDTAAGINETVLSFLKAAPETIITITTEPTSLTDAYSLLKVLKQQGFNHPVQVLVNKAQSFQSAKEVLHRFAAAVKKYLGIKVISPGYVLEDRNVARSIMVQKPYMLMFPQSPASCCVRNFADKLEQRDSGQDTPFSSYLSDQMVQYDANSAGQESFINKPWLDELLETVQSAPFDEAEQLMALLSTHWIKRVDEEYINTKYPHSAGYRAAIRFASKLNVRQ